jgi:Fic family protein
MTNREFYTNIANGTITEAEKEFALAAIAKLDATNEKRKNKTSPKDAEKQAEMAVLRESIFAVITNDPQTEADIAAQVGVTGAKARAQLRKLVDEGRVVSADIKVPKKGACKGYSLAPVETVEG